MPDKTNKVGTQLLVSPHLRDRARALAIVRHERVAEVYRAALENDGLTGLEKRHDSEIQTLNAQIKQAQDAGDARTRSDLLAAILAGEGQTWEAAPGAPV